MIRIKTRSVLSENHNINNRKTNLSIALIFFIFLYSIIFSFCVFNVSAQEMNEAEKYFPLQIGNKWVYLHKLMKEQKVGASYQFVVESQDTLVAEITKTIEFEGNTYYMIDNNPNYIYKNEYFRNDGNYVLYYLHYGNVAHSSKAYDFAQCEYGKGDCSTDCYIMDIDNCSSPRYVKEIELPIGKFSGYYVSHCMQGVSSVYDDFFIPGIGFALSKYVDYADVVGHEIVDEYSLIGAIINGQTYGVITAVKEVKSVKPSSIKVSAHPNPFNSNTIISFVLTEKAYTVLSVFNIQGQKVATLKDSFMPAGTHSLIWNASGLSSGIYFLRIKAGNFNSVCRVLFMK